MQKFLFVGVGGSGGVTLRACRMWLAAHLAEHGYTGGIPQAWQFVHIDVPLEQDRNPERLPLLPRDNYVGLAVAGLPYREIDKMLWSQGDSVVQHLAGWRPDPDEVKVAPELGGGRFRAVGRVILAARMAAAYARLKSAVTALTGEMANEEFARVCAALTGNEEPSSLQPQVVVVASLAGGSGAGLFGDVCDMLRQLLPDFQNRGVAVLYTPQVFDELTQADQAGINPNALATVCELLNGMWNREPAAPDEFAFLRAAGAATTDNVHSRGPRIAYMIGRTNDQVAYASQSEVYEAVARGVSVWAASATIQDRLATMEIGNWSARAQGLDRTGLSEGTTELPLSSFGCASVGIGLERFARYSIDRLTREAVEHTLSGHWRVVDEKRISEEEARRQQVEVATPHFLAECGIDQKGPHHNDIVDAIRGGLTTAEARDTLRGSIRADLLREVRAQWPPRAEAATVAERVVERMNERWRADFVDCQDRYATATAKWTSELQETVQRQVAALIATEGGKVAMNVLQAAATELTEIVVPELQADLDAHQRDVRELRTKVNAALAGRTTNLAAGHPCVEQAVDAAVDCFHSRTEELVHELAVELIKDLTANLLTPLREALAGGLDGLQLDRTGTSVQPSPVRGWPTDSEIVPGSYTPARNELLLERVSGYPGEFVRLIGAQADDRNHGDALATARHEVITGASGRLAKDQRMIISVTRWVPRDPRLRASRTPTMARFHAELGVAALRARANDWIRRPDTPMARHLTQTLGTYLGDEGHRRQEQHSRIENFRAQLALAAKLSRPLVAIDPPRLMEVHGRELGYREVMTPLPFPEGHPAHAAARQVFASRGDAEFNRLIGTQDTERIDIFTFLDAPVQPVVMSSLTDPINAQWSRERLRPDMSGFWTWRRARQLPWFVPCTPGIRRAIVRGWFVARFLNQVRCAADDLRSLPTEVWTPERGYEQFPSPLLGGRLRKMDDWLPAIMETMALTVVGASCAPYQRLVQLGESLGRQDELGSRGELVMWLAEGSTAPGAPIPEAKVAGDIHDSTADRAKLALAHLDKCERHYDSYRHAVRTPEDGRTVSRAWELRDDILAAISAFRHVVETMPGAGAIDTSGVG
jgi:tubulin-like protein